MHAVVQAYRHARDQGESELTAFNADAALALGLPLDKINEHGAGADRVGSAIDRTQFLFTTSSRAASHPAATRPRRRGHP
jgi:hypothetical protein